MDIFSLDIGGAFIKTAYLPERSASIRDGAKRGIVEFPMYREEKRLVSVLKKLKPKSKSAEVVVTMTGELCDSFPDRKRGVRHIVKSAVEVFGDETKIFGRHGEFFRPAVAMKKWEEVASANWSAIPILLSQKADSFLHVDIGSTTTDLTPLRNGKVANRGWDDFGRMKNSELLYTGYLRTPIGSVVGSFSIDGDDIPVVPEYFALMGDVYLALGMIDKKGYAIDTPDGAPKTKAASLARLARTVLSERKILEDETLLDMARQAVKTQRKRIVDAILKHRLDVIVTGRGSFILDEALSCGDIKRAEIDFGPVDISNLDPSMAIALIRRGMLG